VKKGKELNMNKNLYVGNLSTGVSDEDLKANFAKAGEVATVNVIKDKFSGQSRGFGFVEMVTEEGAKAAIEMFNGGTIAPRSGGSRSGGGGFGGGRGGGGGGGFGGGRGGAGGGGGRSRY
jgi:cold-inducible RNA-binding protein